MFNKGGRRELSTEDFKALIRFYRGRAEVFDDYANGLEDGTYPATQAEIIRVLEQHSNWFVEWIGFLKEG
jgi:hypothetical protein